GGHQDHVRGVAEQDEAEGHPHQAPLEEQVHPGGDQHAGDDCGGHEPTSAGSATRARAVSCTRGSAPSRSTVAITRPTTIRYTPRSNSMEEVSLRPARLACSGV